MSDLKPQDLADLAADPALASCLEDVRKTEAAFAAHAASEVERTSGVFFSGMGAPGHTPATPAELMTLARKAHARQLERERSPHWRFLTAIVAIKQVPAHRHAGEDLHSSWCRMGGQPSASEVSHCWDILTKIEGLEADAACAVLAEITAEIRATELEAA